MKQTQLRIKIPADKMFDPGEDPDKEEDAVIETPADKMFDPGEDSDTEGDAVIKTTGDKIHVRPWRRP